MTDSELNMNKNLSTNEPNLDFNNQTELKWLKVSEKNNVIFFFNKYFFVLIFFLRKV